MCMDCGNQNVFKWDTLLSFNFFAGFIVSTDDFLRAWTPPALARYAFAIKRRLMK